MQDFKKISSHTSFLKKLFEIWSNKGEHPSKKETGEKGKICTRKVKKTCTMKSKVRDADKETISEARRELRTAVFIRTSQGRLSCCTEYPGWPTLNSHNSLR